MIADAIKQSLAITSWVALISNIVNNPIWTIVFQSIIMITCIVIMIHILTKCYFENRKSRKKKEARCERLDKTDTI